MRWAKALVKIRPDCLLYYKQKNIIKWYCLYSGCGRLGGCGRQIWFVWIDF